jgi:disulfide bond formation protein DsbB
MNSATDSTKLAGFDSGVPMKNISMLPPFAPARSAFAVAFGMFATLAGAWYFQYQLGYEPCPLCLQQRIPYYFAVPLGLAISALALYGAPKTLLRYGLYLLALVLLVSVALGVYHAGVEWKFWRGPTTCAGGTPASVPVGNLLDALKNPPRFVPCDEAAWRFLGISLAGYNALISGAMAALSFAAARRL